MLINLNFFFTLHPVFDSKIYKYIYINVYMYIHVYPVYVCVYMNVLYI